MKTSHSISSTYESAKQYSKAISSLKSFSVPFSRIGSQASEILSCTPAKNAGYREQQGKDASLLISSLSNALFSVNEHKN